MPIEVFYIFQVVENSSNLFVLSKDGFYWMIFLQNSCLFYSKLLLQINKISLNLTLEQKQYVDHSESVFLIHANHKFWIFHMCFQKNILLKFAKHFCPK